jgi:ribose 5-phosphate isomerase A
VEIIPFGAEAHVRWLNTLGGRAEFWREDDGSLIVTDGGNYLALCWFPDGIDDAPSLARELADRPGIVEHGLFIDMADVAVVAGPDGIQVLERR